MEDAQQGQTFEDTPLPLSLCVLDPRIVRVRLGERTEGSPASFLPVRAWPPVPFRCASGWPARIDTGELIVELSRDTRRLSLCGRDGTVRIQIALDAVALGPRIRLRLEASEGQHYYGLGAGGQPFDRVGVARRLWNHHVNHGPGAQVSIPLLLSQRGYGLFFDCSSYGEIAPGDASGTVEVRFTSD